MAREQVNLKVSGLWTYEDVFSAVPEGSLSMANNVVIDQRNLVSPRRGYESLPIAITSGGGNLPVALRESVFSFLGAVHFHTSSGLLYYLNSATEEWHAYTETFVKPVGNNRSRHAAANKNVYITSQNGVQKIPSLGGTIVDAGARPGYAPDLALSAAGTLFLIANQGAAYRILWGYKDTNNNLILGAPSARAIILNGASVNQDVSLSFSIPSNVTTSWFYQIYRTKTAGATSLSDVGDEMFLSYEGNPTAGEITAKRVTGFIDGQPDELLGIGLYTNATEEGILNSNNEPPQCSDIALYQNYTFYANTSQKAATTIQLLGTGVDGLQINDTITIAGKRYKAVAVPNNAGKDGSVGLPYEFLLESSTGSPSADVELTAKDLISKFTQFSTTIDAYYLSEISGDIFQLPGQIRFVEKDYNLAPAFVISAVTANPVASVWTPNLGGSGQTAVSETNPNRIYYSKFGKPEAVPTLNFFDVGPASNPILRIHPLRASLLIFTNREIYQLSGTTDSAFQVNLLDNTARLLAPDSTVVLSNSVIGLFDQGICQVSGNLQVLSRPIEGDLLTLRGLTGSNLSSLAFGIGYESDRKYILYLPFTSDDTELTSAAYVYNTVTGTWTLWDKAMAHGVAHLDDDKLYMLRDAGVSRERKDFNEQDIADEQIAVTPLRIFKGTFADTTALQAAFPDSASVPENARRDTFYAFLNSTGTVWEWSTGSNAWVDTANFETVVAEANLIQLDGPTLDELSVGDIYFETDSKFSRISFISLDSLYILTEDSLDWSAGTWEVRTIIPTEIRFNPIYMGNPAMLKQFSECTMITTSSMENVTVGFKGVSSSDYEDVLFAGASGGAWGLFEWGNVPWGGDSEILRYRTYVPSKKQKDSAISIRIAQDTIYNNFEISGLSIIYRVIGPRVMR